MDAAYCATNAIVSFSCVIRWDKKKEKKTADCPNWKDITRDNFRQYHDATKNGFAIMTGAINKLIVVDADEGKAAANGTPIDPSVISLLEQHAQTIVKTPNGRHFYFSFDGPLKSGTDIRWNGTRIAGLDLRADGGIIYAPPTIYLKDQMPQTYSFIKGNLSTLSPLPETILNALQTEATLEHLAQDYAESEPTEVAEDLLRALKPTRWDSRSDWLQIGIILFNENLPLPLWDSYSRQSTHYTVDGCPKAWRSFKKGTLTLRSLWKMVKDDNPQEFKRLQRKHINIKSMLEPAHLPLARLFHALRPDDYVYCGEMGWYERRHNNAWLSRKGEPPGQVLAIADCLSPLVQEYIQKAKEDYDAASTEQAREFHKQEMREFLKVSQNLANKGFLSSIQSLLVGFYNDDKFFDSLDTQKNLFAFENGVFDLDENIFRPIQPEDRISITCGYSYNSTRNEEVRREVLKLFDSIFEDVEMRDYFLRKLAYQLHGQKQFQEFDMWKGKGSNGKSLLIRLLENVFGPYCQNIPVSYFTEDNKAGKDAPLPGLVQCRHARLVWASEPEPGSTLQAGFFKTITGGETIKTRDMYKSSFSFMPQFGVVLLLNDFPKIPRSTEFYAIKRRVRVIPFPFQFMDSPESENHRPINRGYERLVASPEWRDEVMHLLLETYSTQVKNLTAFVKPRVVEETSNEFFEENNPIAVWIKAAYDCNAADKHYVSASEMTNHYNQENPGKQLTAARFGSFMSALGFHSKKSDGRMIYRGFIKREGFIEG